jgi:hypothetical protein
MLCSNQEEPVSDVNPYQSPENPSVPERPLIAQAALTDTMLRYLREASPWLRFLGIMGIIASGLMIAGGIIAAIVMSVVPMSLAEELGAPDFPMSSFLPLGILGLVYVPVGVLFFFPSRFIYLFGAKIRSYMKGNAERELELAFKNNKSLWKFYGILCIINLAFVPLGIAGGLVVAITSAILG